MFDSLSTITADREFRSTALIMVFRHPVGRIRQFRQTAQFLLRRPLAAVIGLFKIPIVVVGSNPVAPFSRSIPST